MNNNALSKPGQVTRIRGLVQNLKSNGVTVPKELTDEIKLLDSLRLVADKKHAERESALDDLLQVPASDFEDALRNAQSLWEEGEPKNAFTSQVEAVQYRRVLGALMKASDGLMEQIGEKINQVVEDYKLNDVRLPQDLATFDYMRASTQDIEAITAYRQAVPVLNALWRSYKSIASALGQDLNAKEWGSALDVLFLVSDVEDWYTAKDVAEKIPVLRLGLASMKNIEQLGFWALINMAGLHIEVKPLAEAQYNRAQAQNPNITAGNRQGRGVTLLK